MRQKQANQGNDEQDLCNSDRLHVRGVDFLRGDYRSGEPPEHPMVDE
jgi:hypothetical protein